jgi:hypothetical protein
MEVFGLAVCLLVGLTVLIFGQQRGRMADPRDSLHVPILTFGPQGREELKGLPDDWSHHHLVFSDPGTEEEAVRNGTLAAWLRVVNDPRYIMQQLKRRSPAQGPAADYVARMNELARAQEAPQPEQLGIGYLQDFLPIPRGPRPVKPPTAKTHRDWSMSLGSSGTVGAGQYPAKYSFSTSSASCSDYVVYNTGLAGSSSQATVVAYTDLYGTSGPSGTGCGSGSSGGPVPAILWAYNTGGTAALSPVISWEGDQVAFIQTTNSEASLVLLRMANSGGTVTNPASITQETSAAAYSTCNAPCYYAMALYSSTTTPNDTNSPPFYDYAADTMYVGDNSGKVHKFNPVFSGTPAEVTTAWPATASTESKTVLTGAIYDPNSTLLFVADNSGYLHSVTTTGSSSQTVETSTQMDYNVGFTDAPLVDCTASPSYVYVFAQHTNATWINQFEASSSINGSLGTYKEIGAYGSTTVPVYSGAFDNQHTTSSNGNLYFCALASSSNAAYPTLYQIAMASTFSSSTVIIYNAVANGTATCSPITEFYNGTNDYIFLSVTANGNATTGCTGACLYNFSVPTSGSGTAGTAAAGLAVTGGASGTIIDNNSSTTGASQIYFSTLKNGSSACAGNGTTGNTIGGCAVQASQSSP